MCDAAWWTGGALTVALLACVAVGCGPRAPEQRADAAPAPSASETKPDADDTQPAEEEIEFRAAMDLYFIGSGQHDNTLRKPKFILRTPDAYGTGQDSYGFNDATATITTDAGEEVTLTADRGTFDRGTKEATLEGAVTIDTADYTVQAESVVWNDLAQTARSDAPVTIVTETGQFNGEGMIYSPEERNLRIFRPTSRINIMGRNQP
jgi:lipopolysaccharide-assembly LptC-related protein